MSSLGSIYELISSSFVCSTSSVAASLVFLRILLDDNIAGGKRENLGFLALEGLEEYIDLELLNGFSFGLVNSSISLAINPSISKSSALKLPKSAFSDKVSRLSLTRKDVFSYFLGLNRLRFEFFLTNKGEVFLACPLNISVISVGQTFICFLGRILVDGLMGLLTNFRRRLFDGLDSEADVCC